jgi:hypothetical protein
MRTRRKLVVGLALGTVAVAVSVLMATNLGAFQTKPTIVAKRQATVERIKRAALVLEPTDRQAKITAREAWDALQTVGQIETNSQLTARLASVTNEEVGPADASGKVAPMYRDVVAWVIEVPDVLIAPSGPPGVKQELQRCPGVYVVDATTGKPLFSYQLC